MDDKIAKAKPLVRGRIEALLKKTIKNGCTEGEAAAALEKARDLVRKYGFSENEFTWPTPAAHKPEPKAKREPKPKSDGKPKGLGVGKLAEELNPCPPGLAVRRHRCRG